MLEGIFKLYNLNAACQPGKTLSHPNENSDICRMCLKCCKYTCGSLPYLASSSPAISDIPCSSEEFENSVTYGGKGMVSGTPGCSEQQFIHWGGF